MGPGGSPGLQSLCRASLASGVGSIPTRSRQLEGGGRARAAAGVAPPLVAPDPERAVFPRARGAALVLFAWLSLGAAPVPAQIPAPPDSAYAVAGGWEAPTWVMGRSLLLPGWGQAKNGTWLKSLLVAGLEGAFLERLYFEDRRTRAYRAQAASAPLESAERARLAALARKHRGHRRDFTWWTSLVLILSMADAYVDAHLGGFDVGLQEPPVAPPPAGIPPVEAVPEVRIAWTFTW